jgi:GMP synthase-like glutamine amidotransferase
MRFYCLQHVSFETPGVLAGYIREGGHSLRIVALFDGNPLPSASDFDALVIMGGPMSVHDEDLFPWLRAEKELIAAAISQKKKVLGICLGAQLIAEVAGGRVYPNPQKEIGYWAVEWTEDARELLPGLAGGPGDGSGLAGGDVFFHWHGETFDLPPGARLLASTEACLNQGFLLGDNVLGLQFHPEVTPEIVRAMVDNEGHELVDGPYIQTGEEILAGAAEPRLGITGMGTVGLGKAEPGAALISFLISNTL